MERPARHPRRREPRYVELRCQSAFSFLCGASLPEDLVARAQALGHTALALTDRDGVYGAPRFYKAAKEAGLRALVGEPLQPESATRSARVKIRFIGRQPRFAAASRQAAPSTRPVLSSRP